MPGPLKGLLDQVIRRTNMGRRVEAASVVEAAKETVESLGFLPRDLRVLSFHDGVISIACANGAVAQAFRTKMPGVLDALKRRLPGAEISELRIRIGMPPTVIS